MTNIGKNLLLEETGIAMVLACLEQHGARFDKATEGGRATSDTKIH